MPVSVNAIPSFLQNMHECFYYETQAYSTPLHTPVTRHTPYSKCLTHPGTCPWDIWYMLPLDASIMCPDASMCIPAMGGHHECIYMNVYQIYINVFTLTYSAFDHPSKGWRQHHYGYHASQEVQGECRSVRTQNLLYNATVIRTLVMISAWSRTRDDHEM